MTWAMTSAGPIATPISSSNDWDKLAPPLGIPWARPLSCAPRAPGDVFLNRSRAAAARPVRVEVSRFVLPASARIMTAIG
ncbi:MAG: hypothetical protein U1E76_21490 [Planctomycetota bacterium]